MRRGPAPEPVEPEGPRPPRLSRPAAGTAPPAGPARRAPVGGAAGGRGTGEPAPGAVHPPKSPARRGPPPVLLVDGATVALEPTAVDVDVGRFERLVAEGTPAALAEAAGLYQGDLLAGTGPEGRAGLRGVAAGRAGAAARDGPGGPGEAARPPAAGGRDGRRGPDGAQAPYPRSAAGADSPDPDATVRRAGTPRGSPAAVPALCGSPAAGSGLEPEAETKGLYRRSSGSAGSPRGRCH